MSNKFKIRNLENEKRRIDKLITKLKKEDEEKTIESKVIETITEERRSTLQSFLNKKEITQKFKYVFKRKGNEIECTLTDEVSSIVGKGISKCHNEDLFRVGVGCSLAERRAVIDYYKQAEKAEVRRYN